MLIYIAGSGAMGCRFGYQLQKGGENVILLDRWVDHVNAIKENGLKITGEEEVTVNIPILLPEEATETADLIILFTKAMQLDGMLSSITQIIGENTKVLCLLNGLGHEDVITKYVDRKNIIMGVTVWTAGLKSPGTVYLSGPGTVSLQAFENESKEAGLLVTETLNRGGLNATYTENVKAATWQKACVNGTMNSLCALFDGNIGEVFSTESAPALIKEIITEFVTVGKAEGVELDLEAITNYVFETSKKVGGHYPSMHQDLVQNHRLTEIDYINGAVARKAEKHGIDTPVCRIVTEMIHIKEQMLIK